MDAARPHEEIERERAWGLRAFEILRSYFQLENPALIAPIACETSVETHIAGNDANDAAIPICGTIDRLDEGSSEWDDGDAGQPATVASGGSEGAADRVDGAGAEAGVGSAPLVVVDYKTGRRPPRRFEEDAFLQLHIYALLLHQTGRTVSTLRLLFLGDGGSVLERRVSPADLEDTRQQLSALWLEMLRAFRSDDFPPNVSRLCSFCPHKATCPAFGADGDGAGEGTTDPR